MVEDSSELAHSLDRLTEATIRQTAEVALLAVAIAGSKKLQKAVVALIILVLIGIGGACVVIVQNNSAAAERARVATEQRNTQLEILRRLEATQG